MGTAFNNLEWGNLNANRVYPFSDTASRVDDSGNRLPEDLLVDCQVRAPATGYGEAYGSIFVGSVSVSPGLVSLTLLACTGSTVEPVAALSLVRPVTPYRNYPLSPLKAGTAGWVAFGKGVESGETRSYRFSTPADSVLLPAAARLYKSGGVTSLSVADRGVTLQGQIKLVSGSAEELEIVREARTIDGQERDALVFRMIRRSDGDNPMGDYVGPCGHSPDSNNCLRPVIRAINEVTPDCDGKITLTFQEVLLAGLGGGLLTVELDGEKILLHYGLGMSDICPPKYEKFVGDQANNCDDPCDAFDDPLPAYPLPLPNSSA